MEKSQEIFIPKRKCSDEFFCDLMVYYFFINSYENNHIF